jgi:molybdate transport system substrate-binding protein
VRARTGDDLSVLHLLCAGAARGVVQALQPSFEAQAGVRLVAEYGAVGAMLARLREGAPCDVVVLTASLIEALRVEGSVATEAIAPLGVVRTAIAVRPGDPKPDVHDGARLAAALEAAGEIHFPDPERATAGVHFARVLARLGIADAVAPRLMPAANGAQAMAALARTAAARPIGCTQASEILYTPGVALVGALPRDLGLATLYAAAVAMHARGAGLARRFVVSLAGEEAQGLRRRAGFEAAA